MIYEVKINLKDGTLLFIKNIGNAHTPLQAMAFSLIDFTNQLDNIAIAEDELVISAKIINQSKSK